MGGRGDLPQAVGGGLGEHPTPASIAPPRVFLVVVDDSPEMQVALRYAALRALHTGGKVALLFVIEKVGGAEWMAVADIIREERREEAEEILAGHAAYVQQVTAQIPIFHLREGERRDEVLKLIDEDPTISILVLGASTGSEGPGPLVSHLVGKLGGRMRVPITVVPGSLTPEQVAILA